MVKITAGLAALAGPLAYRPTVVDAPGNSGRRRKSLGPVHATTPCHTPLLGPALLRLCRDWRNQARWIM